MASDTPSPSTAARFFVLNKVNEGRHDTEYSKVGPPNLGPPLHCPRCQQTLGMLSWLPPHRVKLHLHGQDFADLVEGAGGEFLVTERFAEAFRAEGLTGLEGFHPAEVIQVHRKGRGAKPGLVPKYLVATPVYGGAVVDEARSRLLRNKPFSCTWCRSTGIDAIEGLALEAGSWRGEDLFRPRGLWGIVLVSERFARFAEKQAMSHMALVPTELYVWDPLRHFHPEGPPSPKGTRA